ncbi:LacI family DNA-binding transcriptional regulator [Lacticaseibacillus songhuajiangensis]|uniref:LacI family DNA-binding transcriptional regulator n=1 Tax=Lacticaseibacillus songhuajiangensis TaxID=1296539 RepID=UPI000F794034|nr:LacI family DNA-binding transcriptional regulator [Lacticaseibacillus songhuajiangensis]
MAKANVSIKKIAELSGVSIATVSRVLNDNGRFSDKTRDKVLKAIKDSGYQTNMVAKSLRENKSNTVGILVPDITNAFFAKIVQQVESDLFAAGYSTIICNTARNVEKESNYLRMLEGKMIDGLVIISGFKTFSRKTLQKSLPVVCIDREPSDEQTEFVGSDHYEGAVLATRHLANQTERLAIATHSVKTSSSEERKRGFVDAIKRRGISDYQQLLLDDDKPEERQAAIRDFLQRNINYAQSQQPLGIFALSDDLAAEIVMIAEELQIAIPERLKIIGFDDSPIASYMRPQLSTVRQDEAKISAIASSKLIRMMKGQSSANDERITRVPVKLVLRGTT